MKVQENLSSGNRVVICRWSDRLTDRRATDGQRDRRGNGRTGGRTERQTLRIYKSFVKFRQRSYKQRRPWRARVKMEKLVSEGWTGLTDNQFLRTCHPSYRAVCIYIFNCDPLSTWFAWSLNVVSICWTETSLINNQPTLGGIPW